MKLKEFCTTLHQCAVKYEEQIKYEINEVSNLIYSNELSETQLALEKAKDYHYQEILDSLNKIFEEIKKVLFHQDKIEWLSKESNFTKDELRRFSYVKRQVYAFSNNTTENAPVINPTLKREKRQSNSKLLIGSLESWEKYTDRKSRDENIVKDELTKLQIPKRASPNTRRRKKFVSSTLNGFLEDPGVKSDLYSILEDSSSTKDNENSSILTNAESLESLTDNVTESLECRTDLKPHVMEEENNNPPAIEEFCCSSDNENSKIIEDQEENLRKVSIDARILRTSETRTFDSRINSGTETLMDTTRSDAQSIEEIMKSLEDYNFSSDARVEKESLDDFSPTKPKIIDVIYKKAPF